MKALLITLGTTGDIYPMIGLAKSLVAAGHEVCLAANTVFASEIVKADISFHGIPPEWSLDQFKNLYKDICSTQNTLKQFGTIYEAFGPHLESISQILNQLLPGYDVLISSHLFNFFKIISHKHQKPFVTVTFFHGVVPRSPKPSHLPRLLGPVMQGLSYIAWSCIDFLLTHRIKKSLQPSYKVLLSDSNWRFIFDPPDCVVVATSKIWLQRTQLMNSRFHITGYLRHQSVADPQLIDELNCYCDGKRVPVLTFGSLVTSDVKEKFEHLLSQWPAHKKLIVQAGWAGLKRLPQSKHLVFWIDKFPHDQLFQYASMVIHHGGSGTTASALYAGVPQIVIPHLGDQFVWGREIVAHGLGIKINRKNWPMKLLSGIRKIEENPKFQFTAKDLSKEVRMEQSGPNAVKLIEQTVRNFQEDKFQV